MTPRCRHGKSWLLPHHEWCYACGAIRRIEYSNTSNKCWPVTQWTRPQGRDGENPWPMKELKK